MGLTQSKLAVGDLIFDARLLAENPFRFHPLLASELSGTVLIVLNIRAGAIVCPSTPRFCCEVLR
jgi:hypothetical protein